MMNNKTNSKLLLICCILVFVSTTIALCQDDVEWLPEIQRAPKQPRKDAAQLPSIRQSNIDWVIESRQDWEKYRPMVRKRWLDFVGPFATQERDLPKLTTLDKETVDGIVRTKVKYEILRGEWVEAYIVRPEKLTGKTPGVAVFHSTVQHSIRQPAGVEGKAEKSFGLGLARRGMIAFCPRNYLWPTNDRIEAKKQAARFLEKHPKSKGMARMLFDSMIAVDILSTLPGVDAGRIGCVGHSLGGKEVLYLAAFDPRVKATVSSEGGIGIAYSNWDADWYLGPNPKKALLGKDHNELLALIAPRPFLLVGGDSADGDRSWPFIEDVLPIYKYYDRKPAFGLFNHKKGHAVPPEAEKRIYQWLQVYLQNENAAKRAGNEQSGHGVGVDRRIH